LASWNDSRPLTPADLLDLLASVPDLAALREAIAQKIKPTSIWDTVFAPLFIDQARWGAAKDELRHTIIPIRHKVMHQRPMQCHELKEVSGACDRVLKTLSQKLRKLEPTEAEEVRRSAGDMLHRASQAKPIDAAAWRYLLFSSGSGLGEAIEAFKEAFSDSVEKMYFERFWRALGDAGSGPADGGSSGAPDELNKEVEPPPDESDDSKGQSTDGPPKQGEAGENESGEE
jgi:hypothetical protein